MWSTQRSLIVAVPFPCSRLACQQLARSAMHPNQHQGGIKGKMWNVKTRSNIPSTPTTMNGNSSGSTIEATTNRLGGLVINETNRQGQGQHPTIHFGSVPVANQVPMQGQRAVWMPKSYGTVSDTMAPEAAEVAQKSSVSPSTLYTKFGHNTTYSLAQIRATFYPKFENEKSDQEIRTRMIEMVSRGLATLEVSLKHSGSLFMYAGHEGGAYAKNSFGNIYTAVGVFVLGRMFRESWGIKAEIKQKEFNSFLEMNRICISMELVTAVLGDHGQRPRDDYVVVTAVTELGNGKPNFYSTPEVIAFCRKWQLPTNHVWLFSTRKSVSSFFAAYDTLCEEGTATPVCRALDEVADISVPGSKDHVKFQGEILEGLVARIVSHESSKHMEKVLKECPLPTPDGGHCLGPNLREICASNRSDEKQQIKALLQNAGSSFCPDCSDWFGVGSNGSSSRGADRSVLSNFLQARPADFSTTKLQEMIHLMRQKRFPAAFKCFHNFHKIGSLSNNNLFYKMVIHVHNDSAFRRYQKEMRYNPGLWPLYRGFFVDINLFKAGKEGTAEIVKNNSNIMGIAGGNSGSSRQDALADEDANLMIKLKFLTYKLRTFLIRNGLPILFKEGPSAYKAYYLRQMRIWGTSPGKQRHLSQMLDEWAMYIRRKYGSKQLPSSTYLTEAEPFLEQYAKRCKENEILVGSAGNIVLTDDCLAIIGGKDEEGDLEPERDVAPVSPDLSFKDNAQKHRGLVVFFPGIPGCAKSALCKELLNVRGGLGDDRQVHSLMGDLIKGRYWPIFASKCKENPRSIMLADKNAPNEEVWRQIEEMCHNNRASAVPVVPDSEGTDSNPYSLDVLAVFMFRVLQRTNHPGNLDKESPNAGYVLLMFYHLYEGKNRKEFEAELVERFGSVAKMPVLKTNRSPLPESLRSILEEGVNLYKLHTSKHGRSEPTKGTYRHQWSQWEKQLRESLFANSQYLNSIQVPFEFMVKQVLEQLRAIAKGEYTPSTEKRKLGAIVFVAVSLPIGDMHSLLNQLILENMEMGLFLREKELEKNLKKAHITLAHKRSHGVTGVASYGVFVDRNVAVELTALVFTNQMAALEARVGCIEGEPVVSKNEWPHITIWTAEGVAPKEANTLPNLLLQGKASSFAIDPPRTISGKVQFF